MQTKNYCFTDFNETDWKEIYEHGDTIQYIGWGREICPTTKKRHNQGWIQFTKRVGWRTAKAAIPDTVAIYPCKGSIASNEVYCRKNGEFTSMGIFSKQGVSPTNETTLDAVKHMIDDGSTIEQVGDVQFGYYCRYYSSFSRRVCARLKNESAEFRKLTVSVYSGETGTGKTRKAIESGGYFMHADEMMWWDGYNGESTLILDEYNNQVKITRLLAILDGYQLRLAVKGGFTYALWDTVIITTNLDVLHEHAKDVHRRALDRRIHNWVYFEEPAEVTGNITVTSADFSSCKLHALNSP